MVIRVRLVNFSFERREASTRNGYRLGRAHRPRAPSRWLIFECRLYRVRSGSSRVELDKFQCKRRYWCGTLIAHDRDGMNVNLRPRLNLGVNKFYAAVRKTHWRDVHIHC